MEELLKEIKNKCPSISKEDLDKLKEIIQKYSPELCDHKKDEIWNVRYGRCVNCGVFVVESYDE